MEVIMKIKSAKEINEARKIIFSITIVDKNEIIINKDKNIILHNGNDITNICMSMLENYVSNQDYTGGLVAAKILNGTADMQCKNFINSLADYDSIILE